MDQQHPLVAHPRYAAKSEIKFTEHEVIAFFGVFFVTPDSIEIDSPPGGAHDASDDFVPAGCSLSLLRHPPPPLHHIV